MIPYIEPVFRPPSEARSLIFQITIGCSRNRCRFCGMYKGKPFRVKPLDEVTREIEGVPERYRPMVDRVFLADGDAVVYPQEGLLAILDKLGEIFPNLTRVASYASPAALATKSEDDLRQLRERKLRIMYFGLESGDDETLAAIDKGFSAIPMRDEAMKVRAAGIKLSVTAILGLAGREGSMRHARATAGWVTDVSPEYFSLLTLFHRHNDDFVRGLTQCTHRELLQEARELALNLNPMKTILRSNHASNFLHLEGSYPKDRERVIAQVDAAITRAGRLPGWLDQVPDYGEEYY